MKKLFLAIAILFAMNASAGDTNSTELSMLEAYTINVNSNSLVKYLGLTEDQKESVEEIHRVFSTSFKCAATMNDDSRKAMLNNAIQYDLKHMRYVLTDEQYRKYLRVLNQTIINRGIDLK